MMIELSPEASVAATEIAEVFIEGPSVVARLKDGRMRDVARHGTESVYEGKARICAAIDAALGW